MKCSKSVLIQPLTNLFNIILRKGEWPRLWKLSFITPIYKVGDKSDPNNYRGIAVSSCINKIFTKVFNKRLESYLEKSNLLNKNQLVIRKTTEQTITYL
jgi:hypothetical protein